MRKTGWIALISGAVLSVALFLVRQTRWYAVQRSGELSDFAQTVNSAFWAALITTVFGLVLLLLTLRRRKNSTGETAGDHLDLPLLRWKEHRGRRDLQALRHAQIPPARALDLRLVRDGKPRNRGRLRPLPRAAQRCGPGLDLPSLRLPEPRHRRDLRGLQRGASAGRPHLALPRLRFSEPGKRRPLPGLQGAPRCRNLGLPHLRDP